MYLRNRGIVCWLETIGNFYRTSTHIIGFGIKDTISLSVEAFDNKFPTSGLPELKLWPEWPSVPIYLHEPARFQFKYEDWHVRIKFIRPDDESKFK